MVFGQDTLLVKDSLGQKKDSTIVHDSVSHKGFSRLHITTVPDSAEISLDSVLAGTAPCGFDSVAPGNHVVIAKKKGYFGKKLSIETIAGSDMGIQISLVKPGGIVLFSNPPGARVLLDNKETGTTPCENTRLKPGSHSIRLEKDGYVLYEKTIELGEGATDSLTIQLQPVPVSSATKKMSSFEKVIPLVAVGVIAVFAIVILGIELSPSGR
jgi:hypothetical protein